MTPSRLGMQRCQSFVQPLQNFPVPIRISLETHSKVEIKYAKTF